LGPFSPSKGPGPEFLKPAFFQKLRNPPLGVVFNREFLKTPVNFKNGPFLGVNFWYKKIPQGLKKPLFPGKFFL